MAIPWPTTGEAVAQSLRWATERAVELVDYADVAVTKIEEKVGPWHGQELAHTVTLHQERRVIALPWPIGLLAGLTRGDAPAPYDLVDPGAGAIHGTFPAGTYIATATARPAASCPADIALAARKLAAHLAKQELVGPRQPGFAGGPDKDNDVQQGFALPRAVSELIASYVLPGGFA